MKLDIKWVGADYTYPPRFWGYLINHTINDDEWYFPYYAFWGNLKSEGIQFKRVSEHSMRGDFQKNVKEKRQIYSIKLDINERIIEEFEQQQIIKKLKR